MNFDKPKHRSLAGNTKKEASRHEPVVPLLFMSMADIQYLDTGRSSWKRPEGSGQPVKAAVTIQAAYRPVYDAVKSSDNALQWLLRRRHA